MLDIDSIVCELIDHPSRMLYYSISEQRFLKRRVSKEEYNSNHDLCCFYGLRRRWDNARIRFMGKHPGLFPELSGPGQTKRWNDLVKENGLEEEWFSEYRLALCDGMMWFTQFYGLEEVEAESGL